MLQVEITLGQSYSNFIKYFRMHVHLQKQISESLKHVLIYKNEHTAMSDIKSEGKRHRIFYYLKFYNNFSMLKLWGQYWWPLTVQTICWLSTTVAIVTTMICFLSWPNYTVGHAYNLNWVWQFVNCEQWTVNKSWPCWIFELSSFAGVDPGRVVGCSPAPYPPTSFNPMKTI